VVGVGKVVVAVTLVDFHLGMAALGVWGQVLGAERFARRRGLLPADSGPRHRAPRRAALRQLSNRLVGILHGCLKARTLYDEATAWADHQHDRQAA
jgi:hypothetical protein